MYALFFCFILFCYVFFSVSFSIMLHLKYVVKVETDDIYLFLSLDFFHVCPLFHYFSCRTPLFASPIVNMYKCAWIDWRSYQWYFTNFVGTILILHSFFSCLLRLALLLLFFSLSGYSIFFDDFDFPFLIAPKALLQLIRSHF